MYCEGQSELLGAFVLGLLSEAEAESVRAHAHDCSLCEVELRSLEDVAGHLAYVAPPLELPPGLKRRATGNASEDTPLQVWKAWDAAGDPKADLHVVRNDEGEWQQVRKGVFAKQLYVDRTRDLATMLIRMEPGSRYVPHRHAAPEQCFILQGDVREGTHVFRAGDFQCLSAGSTHGAQWTEEGCLLLIVSSLHDELL